MLNQIEANFAKCTASNCNEVSTEGVIKIVETHNSKCIIDNNVAQENFIIINNNGKQINFLAIDKCVFDDYDAHKRCDFALFDDREFSYVEIKDTDTVKLWTRNQHISKAYDQLEEVIVRFQAVLDFSGYSQEAIVAFRDRPIVPLASATDTSKKLYFLLNYRVDLKMGNRKEYF